VFPSAGDENLIIFSFVGLVVGLALLVQGLAAYREGARVADIAGSRIDSLAAGEIRLTGTVVEAGVALVSPIQSARCVYYRASIEDRSGNNRTTVMSEERAVGFFIDDGNGRIRVFPRGARWRVPWRYEESAARGELPAEAQLNRGSGVAPAPLDREAQIASLLTVRPPEPDTTQEDTSVGAGLGVVIGIGGQRAYKEARIEPGEQVTVVGTALPFGHLDDPDGSDAAAPALALDDAEVAANIEEARAAGRLRGSAAEAWGNAAIPGFGIGRPATSPVLDPGAGTLPLADADAAAQARETFEIEPDDLVVAKIRDATLAIHAGDAGEATERQQGQFLLGMLGALLAIGSAVVLGLVLTGIIGS
jgi:hypothetical protein